MGLDSSGRRFHPPKLDPALEVARGSGGRSRRRLRRRRSPGRRSRWSCFSRSGEELDFWDLEFKTLILKTPEYG